jgi:hypothetical protein
VNISGFLLSLLHGGLGNLAGFLAALSVAPWLVGRGQQKIIAAEKAAAD